MAAVKKKVCIVGAGPSGLVAAKTLLHNHPGMFHCTIYEKSPRVGGLWPNAKDDIGGMVNPDMCTNQSKYTVSFSDFAWENDVPVFPKAWQVGQYLQKYIDTYLKQELDFQLLTNHNVLEVAPSSDEKWKVTTEACESEKKSVETFDHVLIASGFFGTPKIPGGLGDSPVPVTHSCNFRTLQDFNLGNSKQPSIGTKIVVIGGQMSGVEVAASIAVQLSSATYSPGEHKLLADPEKYTVHNIIQQPLWVMPLFFPEKPVLDSTEEVKPTNPASAFLPLDLVMYNLNWRPKGPMMNQSGHITPEAANLTNKFMNIYVGTDQSELKTENLAMKGDILSKQPHLACSDYYTEFVRSGTIVTHQGRVAGAISNKNSIIINNNGQESQIDDVAVIVYATGFEASPSVKFFSEEVLKILQFDASCSKFPLALNVHSTVHHQLPTLGFVGFYRSPYWGVMEMQARYLGKLWAGDDQAVQALANDTTLEETLNLRKSDRLAQFPMGDYAYLMENFSELLGIKRLQETEDRSGIVLTQRYLPDDASRLSQDQRDRACTDISHTLTQAREDAKYIARAVFRGMQGRWKVERTLVSKTPSHPSGTFTGVVNLHPRSPTLKDGKYDLEYLYDEKGDFTMKNGPTFPAKRRYAYRYQESKDEMSAWFTDPADNLSVDYLFHELSFHAPADGRLGWVAKGKHLCINDWYNVIYEFRFQGVSIQTWTMEYDVSGPDKDYRISSTFTR